MRVEGSLGPLARTRVALERGIRNGCHTGGQLYVSLAGDEVADAGFGHARPGEPMTREHRVFWLSSSKPIAALAIARLWERGALDLDDPVARHLPPFGTGGKEAVTVRHLLTHTGGIRMLRTGWPEHSWEEILVRICARRLEPGWVPGRRAGYHLTSSWFVLGELVRLLDGRRFERWVREELFEPLGCAGCWIGMPEEAYAREVSRLAPMSEILAGGTRELPWICPERVTRCSPGANGLGPVRELARVYEMLLAGGELAGRRYLSPQTVGAVTARHRVGMVDRTFRARLDWGLGVILDSKHYAEPNAPYQYGRHAGPRTFGHSGARSSCAFGDPDAGLVVALAVNGLPDDVRHRERFDAILSALYEDLGLDS